jgi:hypothetical protein
VADLAAAAIPKGVIDAAITLVEFYMQEILRLTTIGRTDPDIVLAERLLAWMQDAKALWKVVMPLSAMYQRGPYAIRDAKTARRIVALLEAHGWVARVEGGAMIDDVNYREVWRVRP